MSGLAKLSVNVYDATEIGISLRYFIDKETSTIPAGVPIGFLPEEIEVFLLDERDQKIGTDRIGEITAKSPYIALG